MSDQADLGTEVHKWVRRATMADRRSRRVMRVAVRLERTISAALDEIDATANTLEQTLELLRGIIRDNRKGNTND